MSSSPRGGPRAAKERCRIERLRPSSLAPHLGDILEIEALCFPRPWDAQDFANDVAHDDGVLDVMLLGGRRGDRPPLVVAFCSCRQLHDELHVMQIATHPDHQRCGYGGELLAQAVHTARQRGCVALLLEVRPSNREAVALYAKQGFREVGRRRRYYADNNEDALVMRCDLV